MLRSDFLRSSVAAITALLAAGCVVSAPSQQPQEYHSDGRTVKVTPNQTLINEGGPVFGAPTIPDGGQLINEGGPVFALPGSVRLPAYVAGDVTALTIKAERVDGGAFPGVEPAAVESNGNFTLKGPITSQLFFASTEFMHQDRLHRVRALARAQTGDPIILDAASSLMSAKVALAAQKRSLDALDYTETTELTAAVRSALGSAIATIKLDQPNEALSAQLSEVARRSEPLAQRLADWEHTITPDSRPSVAPSVAPSAAPTTASPSPVPSASVSPSPATDPVK